MSTQRSVDVVIIGAGPAGTSAAYHLKKAGASVCILEARDRIGGRTRSDVMDGAWFEIGGQWVSPDQTELLAILDELGLHTYPRYREGDSIYLDHAGNTHRYQGEWFPTSEETLAEMKRLVEVMDELAAAMDPARPWEHPQAAELDSQTFEQWLATQSEDAEARKNIAIFVAGGMLTKPAYAFSALQAVFMACSAGSFSNLVDENFILNERVVGGMQKVSLTLAERVGEENIILNCPVRTLEYGDEGVVARGDGGVEVRAKYAILAIPPNLYERITYVPELPRALHIAHQHQSMGLVIKVHAAYETPWWRDKGLSGTCFSSKNLVQEIYDNTNYGETRGTLVGFVTDKTAEEMFALPAEERKHKILSAMAKMLGEEVMNPIAYYESDWAAEEWTRGAYANSWDMGGLSRWGHTATKPVGPIHFACSDIAAEGFQHVDGALRRARSVAETISELLAEGKG